MTLGQMRRIRKVVTYLCTTCYKVFPNAGAAKEHHAAKHQNVKKQRAPTRPRKTQTGQIEEAIRNGAKDAGTISRSTKIPLGRVHSLLSYLRRKGKIAGYKDDLRPAKSAR